MVELFLFVEPFPRDNSATSRPSPVRQGEGHSVFGQETHSSGQEHFERGGSVGLDAPSSIEVTGKSAVIPTELRGDPGEHQNVMPNP